MQGITSEIIWQKFKGCGVGVVKKVRRHGIGIECADKPKKHGNKSAGTNTTCHVTYTSLHVALMKIISWLLHVLTYSYCSSSYHNSQASCYHLLYSQWLYLQLLCQLVSYLTRVGFASSKDKCSATFFRKHEATHPQTVQMVWRRCTLSLLLQNTFSCSTAELDYVLNVAFFKCIITNNSGNYCA